MYYKEKMESTNRPPESRLPAPVTQPAEKPLERLREWRGMDEGAYSANTLRAQGRETLARQAQARALRWKEIKIY
jgi:hypothetical protein